MNTRRSLNLFRGVAALMVSLFCGCATNSTAPDGDELHRAALLLHNQVPDASQVRSESRLQQAVGSLCGQLADTEVLVSAKTVHDHAIDGMLRSDQEERDEGHQDQHRDFIPIGLPEPFGISLTDGWFDEWSHSHFSRLGTPFVHLFKTEPAFLGRELILGTHLVQGEDGDEIEIEAEIEWALTRRIGLLFEVPFLFLEPDAGRSEEGIGDFAAATRFLMVDTDRFLLSLNLEVATPTGSERRGLGRGEVALSPTLSWWSDLGSWVTWSGQVGTEHGLETGDDELAYSTGLTYSFLGPPIFEGPSHDHDDGGQHVPTGMVNLMAEFTGRTGLNGDAQGQSTAELLFGVSYLLTDSWEIRTAVEFPLFKPREFDVAYTLGLIYHF